MSPSPATRKVNTQDAKIQKLTEQLKKQKEMRRKEQNESGKRKIKMKKAREESKCEIAELKKKLRKKNLRIKEVENWNQFGVSKQETRLQECKIALEIKKKEEALKTISEKDEEINRLQKQIRAVKCLICFEPFADNPTPRLLFCGHNVCESCLAGLISAGTSNNGTATTSSAKQYVRCPTCRKEWNVLPKIPFPTNYALLQSIGH